MKILVTGNPTKDITKSIVDLYGEEVHTVSRSSNATYSMDLTLKENVAQLAKISNKYDVFVNCALIPDFGQTKILQAVWTEWKSNEKSGRIISFGSAVDYYFRPDNRLYPIEKRSLQDLNRSLTKHVNWFDSKIKCTYFSFGGVATDKTLKQWSHYQHFSTQQIAQYVKWIIESPDFTNIDELHVTPIQPKTKKEIKKNINPDVKIQWNSGDERTFLINEE